MGGGESDGGTGSRLRGTLLTWLSEKTSPVFVIATANGISGLPPEMTRRGRLDEVWFVALPNTEERESIWRIHLDKVNQLENVQKDLPRLAKQSEGFSGAEIEQAVHDTMYDNYVKGETLTLSADMILHSMSFMTPLAKSREEDLSKLKQWATSNARNASVAQNMFRKDTKPQKKEYVTPSMQTGITL